MKQPITVRLDSEMLATARILAKEENRTLTNFLETALKDDSMSWSSRDRPIDHSVPIKFLARAFLKGH